ncbi:cytochrome c family protein [Thioalkalivibrio nitratireducens DSM 14787]|uniref:Cytochrome c family protein n=1 Tax=Thioalkalivibrio nitratireducens (strain DSM 14787 / UNIQEM 213 / ALEN2) TaxID=1255043 RepID=L0E2E8_THIND|nr:c-type cytochrome [Thioalkalivibrio nitratireducens]AGA35417.1 cytochrome c family protein [Thioalkalivibrio nitratireducens DSM 14787]
MKIRYALLALSLAGVGLGPVMAEPGTGPKAEPWTPAELHAALAAMPKGDPDRGREVHDRMFCASCHGPSGESPSRNWPTVAGQRGPYVYKMLLDYRDGRLLEPEAEPMAVLAEMMSEQEMADVAAFYDAQELPALAPLRKEHPADTLVRRGDPERLITPCAACHGVEGQGGRNETPALAGQQPEYLVRAMRAFRDRSRDNDVYHGMGQFAWDLTDAEIEALADYYAR